MRILNPYTLRMYRNNGRTATLRAQHMEWDNWKEPGAGGTLGAELKSEYFNGSWEAATAFLAGPSASAVVNTGKCVHDACY